MKQGILRLAGQRDHMFFIDARSYTVPEFLDALPFVLFESVLTMCRTRARWSESSENDGDVSPIQPKDLTRFL